MKINELNIGDQFKPVIIAEIGINHGGDLKVAKKMVSDAVNSGADIIKHQTHFVEDEMTDEAKLTIPPNDKRSIWQIMDDCSLSAEEEKNLKDFTEELGGTYISTPFSRKAAIFLNDIGVPAFKIGSGECCNLPLIRLIASFGKPVIMSTGMHSVDEIKPAVKIFEENKIQYALLECTNLYPSPPENVSLKGITELKNNFPNAVIGFSDHSLGPYMALSSIPLGARIIERHFTDSMDRDGPDIICSMNPEELKVIKKRSNEIFIASRNNKQKTKEEEDVLNFARSSVVADKKIKKGQTISAEDVWARRPGTGEIPGSEFDKVIGKTALKDLSFNQQIKWSDLK